MGLVIKKFWGGPISISCLHGLGVKGKENSFLVIASLGQVDQEG